MHRLIVFFKNITMKQCSKCNEFKDSINFFKDKSKKDGLRPDCKYCIKKYYSENINKKKLYDKEYYLLNKEKKVLCKKKYYIANKKEVIKKITNYQNERSKKDSLFSFKLKTRNLIRNSFLRKKIKKNDKTENILGCTIEYFKRYIEIQFKKGMSFENYGEWHLDHIIPMSTAKNEEEMIKLCHYTNFQPLWAKENLQKSNKIINKQLKLI